MKILAWGLAVTALLAMSLPAFGQTLTTVNGTLYNPAGQTLSGTISIYANVAFKAQDGTLVPAGAVTDTTVTNGVFSVALVPTQGSTPAGASYQATYKLGLTTFVETWNVPVSASPVNVSAVRNLPIISTGLVFQGTVTPGHCVQVVSYSVVEDAGSACGTGGGGSQHQVNGTNVTANTPINFENSLATNGLTLNLSNPSAGNIQLGLSGTLNNAGLTNSSTTLNGQTVALGASGNIPFSVNGTNNSTLTGLNAITSTANSVGLTVTP
ncbi:MAG TPA: hypothetical protein VJW77_00170, partial [Terriglobia bacterium]|nr:hypothetical protein [Terriglobia bacterium]